jgi:hypothetical protein
LNALKDAIERSGQGVSEGRIADTGNVFNQQVPTGDQRHDRQPDGFRLTFNDRFDSRLEPFNLVDCDGVGVLPALDGLAVSH